MAESARNFSKPSDLKVYVSEVASSVGSEVGLNPTTPGNPYIHELKRWPDEPQSIDNNPTVELYLNLYDITLCLVPVALIIKVSLCVFASHLDAEWQGPLIDHVSKLTLNLINFNKQLTTIFTIFFILIISTGVRRLALYKAERGATVAELEQYQASISLPSTLKAIWSLRAFTIASAALAFVWSWYYAGSQAAQREYAYQDSHPYKNYPVAFLSAQATSPFEDGTYANYSIVKRTDMTSQFHIYSQKTKYGNFTDGSDIAGAPLIPVFIPESKLDHDGWLQLPHISTHPVASSIGNTIYVNEDRNKSDPQYEKSWQTLQMVGKYTYPTAYFQASCEKPVLSTQGAPSGLMASMSMALNMTATNGTVDNSTMRTFDIWNRYNNTHAFTGRCNITQAHVEVGVVCVSTGCKPNKVRPLSGYDFPSIQTPFHNSTFASSFFHAILLACGVPENVNDLTTFEQDNGLEHMKQGLVDIANGVYPDPSTTQAEYLEQVNFAANLSQSMTRYFNTFYTASTYLKYAQAFEEQTVASGGHLTIAASNHDFAVVNMHGAQHWPMYTLSQAWVAVDLFSCTVLLFAAVSAFWLRKNTLAPDIFGYVSSLTRDNPHLNVPGGSTLSGIDRARRMKHVKVKIGDVGDQDGTGVGRVGLTYMASPSTVAENSGRVPRGLERGRQYV